MKILVTGGAGYIGSHVCKMLARRGYEPVTYDNLSRSNGCAVKWGVLEVGDIADYLRLQAVLKLYEPAAVMHFAGFAYVGESVRNPLLYYQNNVGGSAALLRSIVDFGPIPIVFSSTCATYGVPDKIPISEEQPQRPINPYGYSKLVVEQMLIDLDRAAGLRSVSLRYFNAAGCDPEGEIGEEHEPEPHIIPLALMAARNGTEVEIFGDDYNTRDGSCIRDYIHVMDLAEAHVLALDYLLKAGKTCALNLANERGYSVKEVVETAERVSGKKIRVKVAPRRPGDPEILIGVAELARVTLGWVPKRAALEIQIADAWNWMLKHKV
jgi:UDP-glucose-4-epimerase GalE